jgi:indolepyruvate ferredoxin oxidoreductase beta subunit
VSAKVVNIVFAGLGGQGVLKASDITADAAFRAGLDVKKSEIHGMSQRGGSVTSDVRLGERVLSPMVPEGEADFLVVIAPDQVENNRAALRPGGVLIQPADIDEAHLKNKKSLNVALLGRLSRHLDLSTEIWRDAIRAALPEKLHETNMAAFDLGREQ